MKTVEGGSFRLAALLYGLRRHGPNKRSASAPLSLRSGERSVRAAARDGAHHDGVVHCNELLAIGLEALPHLERA